MSCYKSFKKPEKSIITSTPTSAHTKIPIYKGYKFIFRTDTQPSEVIGADYSYDKKLMHLIKWEDGTESLVYAAESNLRCPQLVIAFYEKHLKCLPN